jgi:hypothetical protein
MTRTEIPWSRVLAIWWAAAWRAVLIGYIAIVAVGLLLMLTIGSRLEEPVLVVLLSACGAVWQAAVSIWALWFALSKEYRGFRIVITSR